jgi:Ulp1 family protease
VEWSLGLLEGPKQDNEYDCGLYSLSAIYCILHRLPIQFPPLEMSEQRLVIANAILKQGNAIE